MDNIFPLKIGKKGFECGYASGVSAMADFSLSGSFEIAVDDADIDFFRMGYSPSGYEEEKRFDITGVGFYSVVGKSFFGEKVRVELLAQSMKEFGDYELFSIQCQESLFS